MIQKQLDPGQRSYYIRHPATLLSVYQTVVQKRPGFEFAYLYFTDIYSITDMTASVPYQKMYYNYLIYRWKAPVILSQIIDR